MTQIRMNNKSHCKRKTIKLAICQKMVYTTQVAKISKQIVTILDSLISKPAAVPI